MPRTQGAYGVQRGPALTFCKFLCNVCPFSAYIAAKFCLLEYDLKMCPPCLESFYFLGMPALAHCFPHHCIVFKIPVIGKPMLPGEVPYLFYVKISDWSSKTRFAIEWTIIYSSMEWTRLVLTAVAGDG